MDQDLLAKKRAAEADPGDHHAAREYEAALARAGEQKKLEERYGFKFLCDRNWLQMKPVAGKTLVRFCDECKRDVTFVSDLGMLRDLVAAGQCVAIDPRYYRNGAIEGLTKDARFDGAEDPSAPCVVEFKPVPMPRPLAGMPVPLRPPVTTPLPPPPPKA